jgi:hypothetical protein
MGVPCEWKRIMAEGLPWDREPTTSTSPIPRSCTRCFAQTALSDWLKSRRRERHRAEIAAYAKEHAGTDLDLDRDLELDLLAVEDGIRAAIDLDS